MSEDSDFEKKFSEIINSDDLKDISNSIPKAESITIKDILLIQQSLIDSLNNTLDILRGLDSGEIDLLEFNGEELDGLMLLYKVSEEFNSCIEENFVILTVDDEDLDDEIFDNEENEEDGDD